MAANANKLIDASYDVGGLDQPSAPTIRWSGQEPREVVEDQHAAGCKGHFTFFSAPGAACCGHFLLELRLN